MIYAYIRVSTDKQTVENQRFEINRFAKQRDFQIDVWVEETVSGTRSAKDRKLGVLLKRIKKGDTLIVSEISRLGRRLMEVMSILNACMLKNVILLTVKEKYELGNNIQSQILAFAFSLSAQIERDLISQRTREGLARRIASGHLTLDMMRVIMGEEKKSDLDRVTFTSDTLRKYFPKSYTPQRMQETIIKLLEAWQKKRQRDQER